MPHVTGSQTIGPFWHALADPALADLTRFGPPGAAIALHGCVRDGDDAPVTDACIEIWQGCPPADAHFPGWGRCATDAQGWFRFRTIMPAPGGKDAPHVAVAILARGLMRALHTRAYFQDAPRNATDPLLARIDPARRATLLATPDGPGTWRFDIRLQGTGDGGAGETVFLALSP